MKKKLTLALGLLTLSALFVGCGSDEATKAPELSEEITAETLENTESSAEVQDEKLEEKTPVSPSETETSDVDSIPSASPEVQTSPSSDATLKPEASTEPSTDPKPQASTKPNTDSKPQASTKPNTDSKPQASTKPNTNSKPQTPTKPNTNSKPQTPTTPIPDVAPQKPDNNVNNTTPEAATLSCEAIFNQIASDMTSSNYQLVDSTLLTDFYGMDTSLLDDFHVKMPMMSFSITEVGVFKVKDVNNIDSIVSALNKRANDIGMMLYPSLEETYQNRQIITKGEYILFVISDNVDSIVSSFNTLV